MLFLFEVKSECHICTKHTKQHIAHRPQLQLPQHDADADADASMLEFKIGFVVMGNNETKLRAPAGGCLFVLNFFLNLAFF